MSHETHLKVRFYEVDPYQVAWHGHYISWFEVARNELASRFGLDPMQLKDVGVMAPVVDYLVATKFRGEMMGWYPYMLPTRRMLTGFGYTESDLPAGGNIIEA